MNNKFSNVPACLRSCYGTIIIIIYYVYCWSDMMHIIQTSPPPNPTKHNITITQRGDLSPIQTVAKYILGVHKQSKVTQTALESIQGIRKRPTHRFEDNIVWERWHFWRSEINTDFCLIQCIRCFCSSPCPSSNLVYRSLESTLVILSYRGLRKVTPRSCTFHNVNRHSSDLRRPIIQISSSIYDYR